MLDELNMCTEQWWNDSDRRKSKYSDKNLSQYNFVQHKPYAQAVPGLSLGLRGETPAQGCPVHFKNILKPISTLSSLCS